MHYIRTLLICDEIASRVFGKAGFYLGQDLGMLALGVELLQLRAQAGTLGCGGLVRRIRLSGTWSWVPFAFFPSTCFRVRCRARLNARSSRGALNAGRAWIPDGGAFDGFGRSTFQFSGVVLRGLFLFFCRSPRHRPENALQFL